MTAKQVAEFKRWLIYMRYSPFEAKQIAAKAVKLFAEPMEKRKRGGK